MEDDFSQEVTDDLREGMPKFSLFQGVKIEALFGSSMKSKPRFGNVEGVLLCRFVCVRVFCH